MRDSKPPKPPGLQVDHIVPMEHAPVAPDPRPILKQRMAPGLHLLVDDEGGGADERGGGEGAAGDGVVRVLGAQRGHQQHQRHPHHRHQRRAPPGGGPHCHHLLDQGAGFLGGLGPEGHEDGDVEEEAERDGEDHVEEDDDAELLEDLDGAEHHGAQRQDGGERRGHDGGPHPAHRVHRPRLAGAEGALRVGFSEVEAEVHGEADEDGDGDGLHHTELPPQHVEHRQLHHHDGAQVQQRQHRQRQVAREQEDGAHRRHRGDEDGLLGPLDGLPLGDHADPDLAGLHRLRQLRFYLRAQAGVHPLGHRRRQLGVRHLPRRALV
mmetsp:Transcript_35174/g.76888  ORF Transcript_35174/g.76888 Transcript_35174/m.76888 type:complete len:322 (+) Transcript_35174:414-1379(+)